MTSEERKLYIRKEILRALADCSPYLLRETILFEQVSMVVAPSLTQQEFESEFKWLEREHLVAGVPADLGGPRKWKISELGRATTL